MANLDKEGIEFLNRLYKDMYKSDGVMHGIDERFIGNKTDNIGRYINRMKELHERVATSGRENDLRMLKEFYYQKYVIKENDIPDSYYEHQKEIYLERGYGHVEFTEKDKHEMALQIISEQKKRLDIWIEYFVSNDSSYIPMWAKYWAFQGMLSLGNYDKKNKTFGKRSKGTTSPFIDLNREALALSIDFLLKALRKEEIDDKQLEVLVQGGSFGKIYSYILNNVLNKNNDFIKSTDGKWVKYNQGSDYMPLVKSLQGYNTGWCTAGEKTAKYQLSEGDFYVYYTNDKKGDAVVPRIAIRTEYGLIAEIRGVADEQGIEPEMIEILDDKLEEFPDKDKYKKKVNDMKLLTMIYKKFKNGTLLTKEDLKFLYQFEGKIEGFGYSDDPRVDEILSIRNMEQDLCFIFNCHLNQIGVCKDDLEKQIVIYHGDLSLAYYEIFADLILPKVIIGDLILYAIDRSNGIVLPDFVYGNLDLSVLETIKGLSFPKKIVGNLYLKSLKTAKGSAIPSVISGDLYLSNLISAEGLTLPNIVKGSLFLDKLISAEGLKLPETLGGSLILRSLTTANGLTLPNIVKGSLFLDKLISVEGLRLPQIINGDLNLSDLTNLNELELPKIVNGYIYLHGLNNLNGIVLPEKFNRIYLANGVVVTPENIHEYIDKPKSK